MMIETRLVPRPYSAMTVWPFIFVRPGARDNDALLQHELVHYREQAWRTPWWWARYAFSPSFRVQAEVRAYRVQIAAGMPIAEAASWLTTYDRSLTPSDALELLRAT